MIGGEVLSGDKVRLRPVEERDVPDYVRWFNEPEVRHWLYASERADETLESQKERIEELRNESGRLERWIENLDGQAIGCVGIFKIDTKNGDAELYIFMGEKDQWSRGYGTEAVRRVPRYAFADMGLRRVELDTDDDNLRGLRCFEKCGFVREGLLRVKRLRHGQPVSRVVMAILREEFEAQPWR